MRDPPNAKHVMLNYTIFTHIYTCTNIVISIDFSKWTDIELMEALRAKNNEAWDYVFRRYVIPACRLGYNQGRMASCSLCVEEAFSFLWEFFSTSDIGVLNSCDTLEKWIYKKSVHLSVKRFESQKLGNK